MKKIQLFLSNPFDHPRITTLRLVRFAQNAAEALRGEFPALATAIDNRVEAVLQTLGAVAFHKSDGKDRTRAVNDWLRDLRDFMRDNEDALSVALGGRKSAGFTALLPQGVSEFTNLTKTKAPETLKRIKKAVDIHSRSLPDTLRNGLNNFVTGWDGLRADQQSTLETLDAERNVRDSARLELEWTLIDALHDVAKAYKKEPEKGERFFEESLLRGVTRRKKKEEGVTVNG
ncbi:hypothetical protein EPD60_12340 [Flaviaesturariibacter flavus]|uniref:Uncharacterized protein n=1 Tax=Flaviaesturariibacter flavus TaxID=2502780 RepID=A0A4R1B9I7_9BACT|nr:hypothetical protein [Flaviaesturariibacter flavus]TCJ13580.1 hypothetical protein EPD60_12340 [Flaviaesturariibacter flavus]